MRGILSCGMVMCATLGDKLIPIAPPSNAVPGTRVIFNNENGTPDDVLNPKKKVFESIQPRLTSISGGIVAYRDGDDKVYELSCKEGKVTCGDLIGAKIS